MPLQIAVLIFYYEVSFIPFSFSHKSQQHPLYLQLSKLAGMQMGPLD